MINNTKHNPDTEAGIFFVAAGALTVFMSSGYKFGDLEKMGPGFFPVILGCILTALGLSILVTGLRSTKGVKPAPFDIRSIGIICSAIVLFGILLLHAGFLITVPLTIIVASFAQRQIKWKQTLLIAFCMTAFTYAVFILGLELRIPLFPEFF